MVVASMTKPLDDARGELLALADNYLANNAAESGADVLIKELAVALRAAPARCDAESGDVQGLLDILDVSVPDDGLLKGKLMMAIGHKGAQMCWTPQNSYEHAVINLLGCKLRDLRAALSTDPGTVAVTSTLRETP